MRKKIYWYLNLLVLLCAMANVALAQSTLPKYEIGFHATTLIPQPSTTPNEPGSGTQGGGARFTYNLNSHLALEGEANLFNRNGIGRSLRAQALGGLKAGKRFQRFGIFGKIRPGVVHEQFSVVGNAPCFYFNAPSNQNLPACAGAEMTRNNFALDAGGVLELYSASRWVVRFDVGDTILRRHVPNNAAITYSPPVSITLLPAPDLIFTRHHLQINAGVGFRF